MTRDGEIRTAAQQWLAWVDAEHDCPERQEQFEVWLCADARHREIYSSLEQSWRRADHLSRLSTADGKLDPEMLAEYELEPAWKLILWTLWHQPRRIAVGATTLFIAIAVAWTMVGDAQWQDYTSELGITKKISLSDGSTITLNTNSEVQTRIIDSRRDVRLIRGEALFDVAHDAHRPFAVEVGDTRLLVLGTLFSARMNPHSKVSVLVSDGRVEVQNRGLDRQFLIGGDAATVDDSTIRTLQLSNLEVEHHLAWTEGKVIFDGVTLAQAVDEMNRYNRWQLKIKDSSLAEMRIGGDFVATDPHNFVKTLQYAFGIDATYSNSRQSETGVILLTKRPAKRPAKR